MTYNVLDVSLYIINYSNQKNYSISNLKLQKLLYFTQAYFVMEKGIKSPCFKEKIEAWDFGPVVSAAYHEFKKYGSGNIPTIASYVTFDEIRPWVTKEVTYDDKVIEDRDKILIAGVVDTFADYSASEIMRLSHKQDPWKNVFRAGENNEITLNSLKEYFR